MTKRLFAIVGALVLFTAGGFLTWRAAFPEKSAGAPEAHRSFDALQARMDAAAAASPAMTLRSLGTVHSSAGGWPLLMLSIAPEGPAQTRALLCAGVHGNEPAGVECLLQFAETFAEMAAQYPGMAFDIVPLVNPWGWIHRRRRNAEGRDLNRDFASFRAQESILMRELCRQNNYDLMVDLHEDSHVGGFYLYRLANPDAAQCRRIIAAVRATEHPIHTGRVSHVFLARNGVITCDLWSLRLARATRQLSMNNYFRLEGCPRVFLFETPSKQPLDKRTAMHRAALHALLDQAAALPSTKP